MQVTYNQTANCFIPFSGFHSLLRSNTGNPQAWQGPHYYPTFHHFGDIYQQRREPSPYSTLGHPYVPRSRDRESKFRAQHRHLSWRYRLAELR